ncbi:gliding motility-associated C-terminal domain-containing protein [Pedobacter sp. MW01-1-1]|uniref:T9SS type B sorting domain-containing protein n=1 Tax=Pedobacter sp. MW01-1-1 TaxID=3383027 RepID=UPI003FEF8917
MKLTKTFLRFALPVLGLMFCAIQNFAQVTYTSKNTSTANGTVGTVPVNDVSNNGAVVNRLDGDVTPINFPMIGVSLTVSNPSLKSNGSYDITYTYVVQNYGAINLNTIQVVDNLSTVFPAPLTYTITSLTSIGTLATNASFNGSSDTNLLNPASSSLVTGTSATITLKLNVVPNATYGTYTNTVTATANTNDADAVQVKDISTNNASPNHGDATKTPLNFDDPTPVELKPSDIQIVKTASTLTPYAGQNITFTITATNLGTGAASPVTVSDIISTAGYNFVSASPSVGSYDVNTGVWSIGRLNVGTSNQAVLTIVATVLADKPVASAVNTASSNHPGDPVVPNNSSTINVVPAQAADLQISNTDNQSNYTPGIGNTYTVVVTNNGPSIANGTTVTYALPAGITGTWSAMYAGGATGASSGSNNINEIVNMPPGSTITYTIITTIPSSQLGVLTTTATVTAPAGVTDLNLANNTAVDQDVKLGDAELTISNTDSKSNYIPGVGNTYTVVANNYGPSDAPGTTVSYVLPAGVTGTWSAVFVGGASGNASGTNNINEVVNMPTGSAIIYTINTSIPSSFSGTLTTTATITPVSNVVDPTLTNNTAVDSDIQNSTFDLSITNSDGKAIYVPGSTNTYTIVASNAGPSDAKDALITFALPAGITGAWSATYTGGATGNASGTNALNETVNIPAGGSITYIFIADIPSNQADLTLLTTATIAGAAGSSDPTPANNTATDTDTRVGAADLSITLTDGKTTYVPGTSTAYTIVATNNGPSDIANATITLPLPSAAVGTWTAVMTGGATGATTGVNSINEVVNMPAGSTITYTITGAIPSGRTGDLTLTATITQPSGTFDLDASNNTSTDTDTQESQVDLVITNTDNKTTYTPGVVNAYTVVVKNTGPSNAPNSVVTFATAMGGMSGTWTAVYTGGATGTASGSGAINEIVNLPANGSVTYTIQGLVPSNQTGLFTTLSTVSAPAGITDLNVNNNRADDTDLKLGDADLSIVNTDNKLVYTPGLNNVYTIVAKNTGPSDVIGAIISQTLPAGVTGTWTAVFNGGATGTASGTGLINETVNLPINGVITYTFTAVVPSGQTGLVEAVVSIAAPVGVVDPIPANNSATDTDLRIGDSDLEITNTDGITIYTPGTTNTYTVVATNNGPSNVTGARVQFPMPSGVTGAWTAVYSGGAAGATAGSSSIDELVNIPIGGIVTYTITANVSSALTGALTTNATIAVPSGTTDSDPMNNSALDIDDVEIISNLSITNTDGKIIYVPGTTNIYSIVATNAGPSDAPSTTITSALPAGVTGNWTAVYTGGATGAASGTGNINELVNLTANGTVTYTFVANIPSGQTGATFVKNATITPAAGITDVSLADNAETDTDIRIGGADLTITNTDNQTTYIPGTSNTYTVVATNNGPSNVVNANIAFQFPAGATGSWTAVYTGGATGNGNGINNANQLVTMPINSTITYTITMNVPSSTTSDFTTVATISLPTGALDPTPENNSASDTDTRTSYADLSITNTDNKVVYTPGTTSTYIITATNNGPSDAPGSVVNYVLPAGIIGTWTAVYTGGATGNASGSNAINETVNIPAGGSVIYTFVAAIPSNQTGIVTTQATITAASGINDTSPSNNTQSDSDGRSSQADLAITNTDGKTNYVPGTTNTYTVVATNGGPSDVLGATITYPVPAGVSLEWTATVSGGATGVLSGTGALNQTVDLPAGSSITYTVIATIPRGQSGPITSTAAIATPIGITDPVTTNNTATDIDTQNSQADLSITNTDEKIIYTPGTTNTYTIIANNAGPSDALNSTITYTLPAGVTGTWVASYNGGSTGTASGSNNINETVNLPAGSSIIYTLNATVPSSQNATFTTVATIATATGVTDPTAENNTASDSDIKVGEFDLSITNTDGKLNYVPGTITTYTVVATNSGPSDVVGAVITYPVPTGTTQSWTAVLNAGATGATSGTGAINETVNIPAGATITYTVLVDVPSTRTGTLSTTATIVPQIGLTDPVSSNNTASDTDLQNSQADLSITNSDGKIIYVPGLDNVYFVVVTNNGPSNVIGATVAYTLPAGATGTWTATFANGATGNASGTTNINETVNLPVGGIITYRVVASVPSSYVDPYTTIATVSTPSSVTDENPDNNTVEDHDMTSGRAGEMDLSITNTDRKGTYTPGTTNTYEVIATNVGPTDALGTTVRYEVPVGVNITWTATFSGGASGTASGSGNMNETVNLPAGGKIAYTVVANISSAMAGDLNTAALILAPVSLTDPILANNYAIDTDRQDSQVDLSISNTDGKLIYNPGTTNTYTVVVTNTGPSDAVGARVAYTTTAAGVTGTWTAVYSGGATGAANGTNSINELVNIPVGGSITYTVIATIPSSQTGRITTTGTVSPANGVTDTNLANNTASDTDFKFGDFDLAITNTDAKTSYNPGAPNTYTVVAINNGPSDVVGATVTYPVPAGTSLAWTAVYAGGASGNASGSGAINETVNMPAGSTITYTAIVTIPSSQLGTIITTATIQPQVGFADPIPGNNLATDIDTQNSQADLSLTLTDGKVNYVPGTTNTYTAVVTNNGPSDAPGSIISLTTPASGITATWTAVYSGGTSGPASGTGAINTTTNIPSGGKITYTIIASVPSNQLGPFTATGTVTAGTGITDLVSTNNTATDIDTQNSQTDLQVVKTVSIPSQYVNSQVTFTIVATNNGPSAATGVTVTDLLPTGFTYVSSTQSIGTYTNATGVWTIGNMANAASATLTVTARVNATGNFTNVATIAGAEGDSNLANNTSQVTVIAQQLPLAVNDAATTNPNVPIPISILVNDVKGFADINPATITIIQPTANGTTTINNTTGVVTYSPNTNYYGTDAFTYTVKDVNGQVSNVATVNITINDFPVIGLAKAATSVIKQVNGAYDITYLLTVGNYGVTDLSDISITDNLAQTFKLNQVKIKSITSLGKLKVNANYNGVGVLEMLESGNTLAINQIEQIQVVLTVLISGNETTFLNSAYAKGISVTGLVANDQSTNGLKPDPITPGKVDPSDPTPVQIGKPNLHIPAGFSPNGDGTHDSFVIEGAGDSVVNFEVYNRWGNLVYRDTNYKNDWTGKCNQGVHIGEDLPEGTYFYIIVLDGTDKYNGPLTLNR